MSISSLLTPKNVEFSKNDQLIHDYILKYPQRTKLMTIQKLASNTGTSIAAVQRFCLKLSFNGFKVHAIVSDDDYLLDYIVTKVSVNDAKETVELITNAHPDNRYLLGNEGYLGKNLHQRLEQMGYTLWTPYRKNMKNAQKHNKHYLMALRRIIESDFLLLSY